MDVCIYSFRRRDSGQRDSPGAPLSRLVILSRYICIYIYIYVNICMHVDIYIYIYLSIYIHLHILMDVCIYSFRRRDSGQRDSPGAPLSRLVILSRYICIYIYVYICMYVCMYIYIYIYICKYIYIYIYIYTFTFTYIHGCMYLFIPPT